MSEQKHLNEQDLRDIIICEPITDKGLQALGNLGLSTDDINEDYFYKNIYVAPKYHSNAIYSNRYASIDSASMFQYSVSEERFNDLKLMLKLFNYKFTSDVVNQSLLIVLGTSGCGKSIETNNKVRSLIKCNDTLLFNYVWYDLEHSSSSLTYGETFYIPDKDDSMWGFYMSLLDVFFKLIIQHKNKASIISENHTRYFIEYNSADKDERELFLCIAKYDCGNKESVKNLFDAVMSQINTTDVSVSIQRLMRMTMNLMYCINPKNKNYIVFDNIEHYIDLSDHSISIPNKSLQAIYECVENVINNVRNIYDRIKTGESHKAFKIILVLRRTTGRIVKPKAHNPTLFHEIGIDHTGHIDIWRIWENKKRWIWETHLKHRYDANHSLKVLYLLDSVMNDIPEKSIGTSYQALVSPYMNAGLRRNAHTQARATMKTYETIFIKNDDSYINFTEFKSLVQNPNTNRYMYRRALMQIQYKWMITSVDGTLRFEQLLMGKLSEEKPTNIRDKTNSIIKKRDVLLDGSDKASTTYTRRVLSCLSNFIYTAPIVIGQETYKIEMFDTISLYDLMCVVFLNPKENNKKQLSLQYHFEPLAKVLTSLGDMSYKRTKRAPMLILDVDDPRNNINNPEQGLAIILEEIWESGAKESSNEGRYNNSDFGVHLTTAGDMFVRDIQPSFSFFAALYCSEEVPLFFLKDIQRIELLIKMVYDNANKLCGVYEKAARAFCGQNVTLQNTRDKYLIKDGNKCITFRKRVKDLHIQHLQHYKDFIDKNAKTLGITDKSILISYIDKYTIKYKMWNLESECF